MWMGLAGKSCAMAYALACALKVLANAHDNNIRINMGLLSHSVLEEFRDWELFFNF